MTVYLRSLDDQMQIPIEEGESFLLGRSESCEIEIDDGSVSTHHARLVFAEGVLTVIDLGSTNGTRLNYSLLVEPAALMDGDTVEFGGVSFIVDGPSLRSASPAAAHASLPSVLTDLEPLADTRGSTMEFTPAFESPPCTDSAADEEWGLAEPEAPVSPLGRILVTALFLFVFIGMMGRYLWRYVPVP